VSLKGFHVFRFVFIYALPIVVFVICYWRILLVIRRQNKVTAGSHAGRLTRVIQVKEAVSASATVDRPTSKISNVKTGLHGEGVEHGNRCQVLNSC